MSWVAWELGPVSNGDRSRNAGPLFRRAAVRARQVRTLHIGVYTSSGNLRNSTPEGCTQNEDSRVLFTSPEEGIYFSPMITWITCFVFENWADQISRRRASTSNYLACLVGLHVSGLKDGLTDNLSAQFSFSSIAPCPLQQGNTKTIPEIPPCIPSSTASHTQTPELRHSDTRCPQNAIKMFQITIVCGEIGLYPGRPLAHASRASLLRRRILCNVSTKRPVQVKLGFVFSTYTRTWSSCSQAKYKLRSETPVPTMPNNIETAMLRSRDHGLSEPSAMSTLRWR